MSNDEGKKKYDLEDRTARFGESILQFCQSLPRNDITIPIINQLNDIHVFLFGFAKLLKRIRFCFFIYF